MTCEQRWTTRNFTGKRYDLNAITRCLFHCNRLYNGDVKVYVFYHKKNNYYYLALHGRMRGEQCWPRVGHLSRQVTHLSPHRPHAISAVACYSDELTRQSYAIMYHHFCLMQIVHALENEGFLYIDVTDVDFKKLFDTCKWFFALSDQDKLGISRRPYNPTAEKYYRGFWPVVKGMIICP